MSRAACIMVLLFGSFLSVISHADEGYSQSEISEINKILSTQACTTECSFRLPSYDHYGRQGTVTLTKLDYELNADETADYILSTPVHCGSSGCLKALLVSHDGYLHKVLESRNIEQLLSDRDAIRKAWADKLNALGTTTALVVEPYSNIDTQEPASSAASCNQGLSSTAANLLFTQAALKHREAEALPEEERPQLYAEVLALLDRIVTDHRHTDLACRIISGDNLGSMNLAEMRIVAASFSPTLQSHSQDDASGKTDSEMDISSAVILQPGESVGGVTFSRHGEITASGTQLFQQRLIGITNFDFFYLRVYETRHAIRIVELYELGEDLTINTNNPLLARVHVSPEGLVLSEHTPAPIPPFIAPADRTALSRLLVQMPYLRVASLDDLLPLHPVEKSILNERQNRTTPFYVTDTDLNQDGNSDFAVVLKDSRPQSKFAVLAIFNGPIVSTSTPAYMESIRILSESLIHYDQQTRMLRIGKLESENALVVPHQVAGYRLLFPSETDDEILSLFTERELLVDEAARPNAVAWDYRESPDLVVLPGSKISQFSLEPNGTVNYKDNQLFGPWLPGNASEFQLHLFRIPREESAVVLYWHRDFGAMRVGLVGPLSAGTPSNVIEAFSRWGPSKLAVSPDGAYVALSFPTGEFTSEIGIFQTETGRFALHQSQPPRPDVFFTPDLTSLEQIEDGVLRLRQILWGYDAYGHPVELRTEVARITLPDLFLGPTPTATPRPATPTLASCNQGLSSTSANLLFTQAALKHREAEALPLAERPQLYAEVLALLDRIVTDHRHTDLACRIISGDNLGSMNLAEMRMAVASPPAILLSESSGAAQERLLAVSPAADTATDSFDGDTHGNTDAFVHEMPTAQNTAQGNGAESPAGTTVNPPGEITWTHSELDIQTADHPTSRLTLGRVAQGSYALMDVLETELKSMPLTGLVVADACYFASLSAAAGATASDFVLLGVNEIAVGISQVALNNVTTGTKFGDTLWRMGVDLASAVAKQENASLALGKQIAQETLGYVLPELTRKHFEDNSGHLAGVLTPLFTASIEELLVDEGISTRRLTSTNEASQAFRAGLLPRSQIELTWIFSPKTHYLNAYISSKCDNSIEGFYVVRFKMIPGLGGLNRRADKDTVIIKRFRN